MRKLAARMPRSIRRMRRASGGIGGVRGWRGGWVGEGVIVGDGIVDGCGVRLGLVGCECGVDVNVVCVFLDLAGL